MEWVTSLMHLCIWMCVYTYALERVCVCMSVSVYVYVYPYLYLCVGVYTCR